MTSKEYKYKETIINQQDFDHLINEYKTLDKTKWTTLQENKHLRIYRYQEEKSSSSNEIFTFKAYMSFPNVHPEVIYSLACDVRNICCICNIVLIQHNIVVKSETTLGSNLYYCERSREIIR